MERHQPPLSALSVQDGEATPSLMPPVRFGPFAQRASAEEQERLAREEKIRDLLPEEDEDDDRQGV